MVPWICHVLLCVFADIVCQCWVLPHAPRSHTNFRTLSILQMTKTKEQSTATVELVKHNNFAHLRLCLPDRCLFLNMKSIAVSVSTAAKNVNVVRGWTLPFVSHRNSCLSSLIHGRVLAPLLGGVDIGDTRMRRRESHVNHFYG